MRIGLIAPLWETVPPRTYGGTELVVHLLACELVREGHDVTVFASGDSACEEQSGALLRACSEKPLRESGLGQGEAVFYELAMLEDVFAEADRFDILHNNIGYQALPFARFVKTPLLTTLHGVFKPPVMRRFFERYDDLPYVSISDYQRQGSPGLNYVATVYHGLPVNDYEADFSPEGKNYLAFLGRLSPEKGVHHAVRVAQETGLPLILAGKIDPADADYFREVVAPEIDGRRIRYIGEVNHAQKVELLKNAWATLCPVTWPEPFGLVLIESMACGTPVLALRDGSIPEVIAHGETGWISRSVEEMIAHVERIGELDRQDCRRRVETHFSVRRMTAQYVDIYEDLRSENAEYLDRRRYATVSAAVRRRKKPDAEPVPASSVMSDC